MLNLFSNIRIFKYIFWNQNRGAKWSAIKLFWGGFGNNNFKKVISLEYKDISHDIFYAQSA